MAKKKEITATGEEKTKKKGFIKRHKVFSGICISVLILIVLFFGLLYTNPIKRVEPVDAYDGDNSFIVFAQTPQISAHRAGATLYPENTLAALKSCFAAENDYVVDVIEFDIHMTLDGVPVLLHDDTLDRTSNAVELFNHKGVKAEYKTFEELKLLNMAESFEDKDGNTPYKGLRGADIPADLHIVSLEEALSTLTALKPDLNYVIEVKDDKELGKKATDELHRLLVKYNLIGKAAIGTFNADISKYIDEKYPDITRSASILEAAGVYMSFLFNLDFSKQDAKFTVLQVPYIPFKYLGVNFGSKAFIDYAHKYGLAVQFWTINDEKDIKTLLDNGADCIMSDDPELAYKVREAI
ncbi:MAG: hypothetical protein LBN25_01170 [Christensenellaceae bacterium]|jgi:glycerophosphoryl diester phosphodiesterase|nr:hypothetical protein [Christensenellaceae bacterium]